MSDSNIIPLMVRLPADLHAEIARIAKGGPTRPKTSLNETILFLLRGGLAALDYAEQSGAPPPRRPD